MRLFLISLWFQMLWFVAVVGREEYQIVLFGAVIASYVLTLRQLQGGLVFFTVVIGLGLDSLNSLLHILEFERAGLPLWLIALWVIFAWYLFQMKQILTKYPTKVIALAGALGGAMSYFAGYKLGAVQWPLNNLLTFTILFVEWGLLFICVQKIYGLVLEGRSVKK